MARYRIALIAILALLTIPLTAFAGGWAIASFDNVPSDFTAGSTYDLEYTILQHGETPVDVGSSQVRIVDSQGGVTAFDAVAASQPGRYSVSVTFPESGTWHWEVSMGDFGTHQLGALEVAAAAIGGVGSGSALRWLLPAALALVLGLVAVQLAQLARKRRSGQPLRAD